MQCLQFMYIKILIPQLSIQSVNESSNSAGIFSYMQNIISIVKIDILIFTQDICDAILLWDVYRPFVDIKSSKK